MIFAQKYQTESIAQNLEELYSKKIFPIYLQEICFWITCGMIKCLASLLHTKFRMEILAGVHGTLADSLR